MKRPSRGAGFPVAALAALVCALSVGDAAAQAARSCSVSSIQGAPVRVQASGRWSDLKTGPLGEAARVVATGPAARLEIRCDDDLVLTLGAGVEVELEGLIGRSGASESVVLRLLRGIVGIDAPNRTWESFEVRTPLAVASARTTAWLVEYAEPTGAGVFVRSGSVDVAAARGGAAVRLDAGEGVTIPPGAARVAVVRWGDSRIAGAGATLGFGWR
jgi:ferric-dicitrate binding protein FerR (iron transport regulator)